MNKQLANLDSLRAFAVLVVLASHLVGMLQFRGIVKFELAALGHIGVLAFFVHTSLVLMFSLERLSQVRDKVVRRFYNSRALRIYPLAILSVLIMLLFRIPEPYLANPFVLPSKLVIASNFLLVQNLIGKTSILGPLWSLPFEVQMYVVLPVCFYVAIRRRSTMYILLLIGAFSALALFVDRVTGHSNLLGYVPCFLSGVLAYTLNHKYIPKIPSGVWPVLLLVWFSGATALKMTAPRYALLSSWLMCLALGFSIGIFRDSRMRVWNRVTNNIAKYSYGIYLLHTPLIYLVFRVWKIESNLLATGVWLLATYGASFIAFHCLEFPFIRLGKRLSESLIRVKIEVPVPVLAGSKSAAVGR